MADNKPGSPLHNHPVREAVLRILYPLTMVLTVAWMLVATIIGAIFLYVATGEHVTPDWFETLNRFLAVVGRVLNPASSDASRLFDTFVVGLGAVIMGVFLLRCSEAAHLFEVLLIVGFLILGLAQLVILFAIPNDLANVYYGKSIFENLSLLLGRNANVALALCGAALGINIVKK